MLLITIILSNVILGQQNKEITRNTTLTEKKVKTVSLERQLKTLDTEKINSLIKNRKVSVESVFNKIKTYKTTTDTSEKTDLILDLCSLSNSELNDLLSRFGKKNEENAKLDIAIANYFKRADALVGQNVFIASLDKTKSEKLNALNKTIVNGEYKRPEIIIMGIVEQDCMGAPCFRCFGTGCYTPPTPEPEKPKGK